MKLHIHDKLNEAVCDCDYVSIDQNGTMNERRRTTVATIARLSRVPTTSY